MIQPQTGCLMILRTWNAICVLLRQAKLAKSVPESFNFDQPGGFFRGGIATPLFIQSQEIR